MTSSSRPNPTTNPTIPPSSSPTPVSEDTGDLEDAEVQRLAAALAPQVQQLADLMDDPLLRTAPSRTKLSRNGSSGVFSKAIQETDDIYQTTHSTADSTSNNPFNDPPVLPAAPRDTNNPFKDPPSSPPPTDYNLDFDSDHDDDDDDDMDHELDQLAFAEDQLRQELTLAEDFASFFGSSPLMMDDDQSPSGLKLNLNFNLASLTPSTLFPPATTESPTSPAKAPTEANPNLSSLSLTTTTNKSNNALMGEADVDPNDVAEVEERLEPTETEHLSEPATPESSGKKDDFMPSTPSITTTGSQDTNNPFYDDTTTNLPPTEMVTPKKPTTNLPTSLSTTLQTPTPRRRRTTPAPCATPATSVLLHKSEPSYTSQQHFQRLSMRQEPQGAWYSVDLTSLLLDPGMVLPHHINNNNNNTNTEDLATAVAGFGMKEYCLSITQWKRLFAGLKLEPEDDRKKQKQQQKLEESDGTDTTNNNYNNNGNTISKTPTKSPATSQRTPPKPSVPPESDLPQSAPVRTVSIRIRPDVLCGAVMDAVTQALMNHTESSIIKRQGGHLQATVTGVIPAATQRKVSSSMTSSTSSRRSSFAALSSPLAANDMNNGPRECTFLVDAQLCTQKSDDCERVLLLRIYHWGKEDRAKTVPDDLWSPSAGSAATTTNTTPHAPQPNDDDSFLRALEDESSTASSVVTKDQLANWRLREACALIQRIESPELAKKIRPLVRPAQSPSNTDVSVIHPAVSEHLLQNYRACPSVLRPGTTVTLPALSPQDWPVIQASWTWIHSVWDELETRELTYLSLLGLRYPSLDDNPLTATSPPVPRFGGFPALPTLDVQYCSQLRRLSREAMIAQLLRAASVLEEYARQAEYECANLVDMLRPTFKQYGVDPPALPKPAPLAAYPLEYSPPQALCPPWGMKVMEALNQVAAMSHAAGEAMAESAACSSPPTVSQMETGVTSSGTVDSLALAETAVEILYRAFQQQDDEEQSARLARKNLQVMDRLSSMENHNQLSIKALSSCNTAQAVAAGDDFFSRAKNAAIGLVTWRSPTEQCTDKQTNTKPWREIPLLKVSLGVGGASGTCTITANQILFSPAKYGSLIGRSQSTWFCLTDVEYSISHTEPTLLHPLSTTIHVIERSSGTKVFAFKPSSSAPRLKSFLDIAQKQSKISK